jgi:hypothetical protein
MAAPSPEDEEGKRDLGKALEAILLPDTERDLDLAENLRTRGYFALTATQMALAKSTITHRMSMAVFRLVAHGYPPTMVLMFDEAWLLGALIGSVCEGSMGNGIGVGDWYVFLVDPKSGHPYMPGPPHRDRPTAGEASFRGDGAPKYCSVWMALTDATPDNSCLYFVPKSDDPGYHGDGDAIPRQLPWQDIVAQPLATGGLLAFSHRLLHWGSKPQHNNNNSMLPRMALTLAFADPSFEAEYFDHSQYLPFPPLSLRLGLVAGQQVQYEHLSPLDKNQVALYRRMFYKHKHYFSEAYAEKISSKVQFLAFQLQRNKTAAPQMKASNKQRKQKQVIEPVRPDTFLDGDSDSEEAAFDSLFGDDDGF